MFICASKKKWLSVVLAAAMLCVCAASCAQSYSLGDEADEIATIQTALKKLKVYSGSITGHYGEKTQAAVKLFQKKYALEDDGIAGEDTIKALYEAAEITYTGSSSSSSSSTTSTSSSSLLRHGTKNDAVRKMQEDLTTLGYYKGNITGNFGNLTEAAVMNFQRANGLSADGVAGAKTLAKIASALSGKNNSSSSSGSTSGSSSSSGSSSTSSVLKYGVRSDAVRTLQQNLKTLGYYSSGSVTGNFGNLTKEAVYQFQRENGLSADGIAGTKTLKKISDMLSGKNSGSSSSSSSSGSSSSGSSSSSSSSSSRLNTGVTLSLNMKNDDVLALQKALNKLGFYSGNNTGNFGEKTQAAVISYQKSKGLTADGVAGKKTLSAINGDLTLKDLNASTGGSLSARAKTVIYSNYSNWRRNYANGEYCTVYDFETGYSWTLKIMSKDKHMDAEPATAEDTNTMYKAFGYKNTWTPKSVWVTFSDGKTYLGSTHNVPHETYHIRDNNFDGHVCVHFPRPMSDAQATGPYATSHQEEILRGWEKTQQLAK